MKKLLFLSVLLLSQYFNASDSALPKKQPLEISTTEERSLKKIDLSPRRAIPVVVSKISPRSSEFKPSWLPTRTKNTLGTPYVLDARNTFSKAVLDQAITTDESEFACIITLAQKYSNDTHVMEEVPRVLVYNKKDLTQSPHEHVSKDVRSAIIWAMLKLETEDFCC